MLRLAPLLASILATDFGATLRRLRRSAVVYALAGLLLISAYAAALVALGVHLAGLFGPVDAALIIALAQIALAALLVAGLAIANALERKRRRERNSNSSGPALLATLAVSVLPQLMRSKGALGLAAVGGLAFLAMTRDRTPDK
ncbi:hypothetical protein [Stappia sp.]|jgi:hypothetical protein|uniref:hypothetical protein n=1 Tax=Stappia sp. TaxID=1870903 RepID=UPI003A98E076